MELDEKKYLYLLFILPIVALVFLVNLYWKRKKQREFGDLEIVKKLSPESSVFKPVLKLVLLLLALLGLILGLVNPKIGTKMETVKREGIDIVFAMDVSKSMLAEDVAPNRLDKSKQVVSQIINQLGSDRIGIVAYAGSAFPVLPITTDYGVAKMYLQSMNTDMVSSVGTSFNEAIKLSTTYFDDKKTSKLLIMISDGEDHAEGAEEAAEEANKLGVKIITIGIGTEKGGAIPLKRNGIIESFKRDNNNEVVITKLNQESLKAIAKATKGGYVNGTNTKEVLEYVKNALNNIQKTEFEATQMADFQSQFQWFLGFAFVFLFLDIFLLERKTSWVNKLNLFNENK
ncbi:MULTISPECIES: VWA domain-containing protein [Flavobacterium]|uniref:VWA domain-containing protein n=1 Tax=Flavobacterium gawalongense TaxID=2594432 RepID=A0A553BTM5_9FLAO|nr:VWA domain-containing protein [Flavobacterium gawalongense]TRX02193.1 VWA domain-containing protein [Flavobacterium gawalongense]TRX07422.1 VWA domain-containing protein [Flavobacterium gawalongense]TRX11590.1 VWA domain-containing protein [Flavobacterium gawalongense]TRX12407.1 VWA domain-containing protein [Flavobacterium gawalongense]TRX30327.1 VWA domain-containing protein [Flavobacterium gawalongense]